MTKTLNITYSAWNYPSGSARRGSNLDVGYEWSISWVEFRKSTTAEMTWLWFILMDADFLLAAAVKVQKSNHHHWDQSSNYCHPPHASHSKTWSSPSHPHNQQDHCKCKLSLVTALLLPATRHSRSLSFCTIVKSFSERFTPKLVSCLFFLCMFPCECTLWMMSFALARLLIHAVLYFFPALVSGGFSPSSTATSGFSSQGSNTLPCPIPPVAPTSPRTSTGKRRNRKKDHKSSRNHQLPSSSCFSNLTQQNQDFLTETSLNSFDLTVFRATNADCQSVKSYSVSKNQAV